MSNTYLHLREEQQKRLDVAMNAPVAACSGGSCKQGRERCETPTACVVPIDEIRDDTVDLYWALFSVALLAVPILAAAFFLVDNWPILVSLWSI